MKKIFALFTVVMLIASTEVFAQVVQLSTYKGTFIKNVYPVPVVRGGDVTIEFVDAVSNVTLREKIIVLREDGYRLPVYWQDPFTTKAVLHIPDGFRASAI